MLSSSEKPSDVRRALAAGALGYVPKSANSDTLMAALHLVLAGEVYVPPLLLDEPPRPIAGARVRSDPARGLTERQFDALRLLARGLTNKEIALELELSEKTVKIHVGAIFKALGVVNRAQAAEAARREGLA